MSRSRGALTKTMVDRYYPHQVMLKNDAKMRKHLWAISGQASQLGASPLGHHFHFDEETAHYSVYCFSNCENAEVFQAAWCAEWLTPEDRKWREENHESIQHGSWKETGVIFKRQ